MLTVPRVAGAAILLTSVSALAPPGPRTVVAGSVVTVGSLQRYDLATFKRLGTVAGGGAAGEFGTQVSENFVVTAPAAAGGGRIFFVSASGVASSVSAAELSSRETARLGEDWGDLGHPPGTNSALAVGAPGLPAAASRSRAARPSVLIIEYNNDRFTREVSRVAGPAGSLFGWRVRGTDSQFPAASFNGSYIVSAPLENRGSRRRAGAVYKLDTVTGRQIWRFRGERAGELAGYDLALIADANGDGFNDVLVGAPGSRDASPAGRIYLLSGANGRVLRRLQAPEGALLFGYALMSGSVVRALPGVLVAAPATPKGTKAAVGAVYAYPDLDSEPRVFQGKRRDQWFGISVDMSATHVFVGSFEGHKKANKDQRGSVTVLLPNGRTVKTIRGKKGGDYFGRALSAGAQLAIGVPGAPPLFVPE